MKRIILMAIVAISFASCKKESVGKSSLDCYECNFENAGWQDMGCMTPDEWRDAQFTDVSGNPLSKSQCRKK